MQITWFNVVSWRNTCGQWWDVLLRRVREERRGLKVNADKSKVTVLSGEEGLECEVLVNG